ncbi:SFT2-domain-containing protein [Dothidotthia symphoricarpi CBS 119687]|uniref:Protein transport protein SFT2 n=1 Tax=Dothidotthia symphoricarpi CBS 119687 TaxID=1392245 RepID=A0A6A6AH28_9PLEO|nr:SFT2-domain-containing protein [Dothidotthia symphoricarpi CBS 119687]KAF2131292.1 SFT2-domain-containing protein [Dothidotthia symphoricarpi CBS 119687]
MASNSFRDSMNSLGWSRREPELSVNTSPPSLLGRIQNLNPFGEGGYVRLPITETNPGAPLPAPTRREEEEGWFALSRWDRLLVFGGLLLAALALFATCVGLMFTPVFIVRPRKFAILWSMGSVLFLGAWGVLMGPMQYFHHLTSGPRLPFTGAYFGTIALTLYFSLGLHSTILTFVAVIAQLICLVWYIVSYFPMGSTGLRFAARFGGNRVAAWMND